MNNEMYLLVFSGSYYNEEIIAEEVISQLSAEMNRFGIDDLEMIDSSIVNLANRYLMVLAGGLSDHIVYDYSTIKITYKEPIAFQRNKELEDFLMDLIKVQDGPCGANFAYLVKEDEELQLHQFAIITGSSGIQSDEEPNFFEKEISPHILYRHLYNQPLQDEDYILEAKMLLVAEGEI